MASKHWILITGPPGIGKTTLITKVSKELSRRHIPTVGFFTEEVRQNGQRTGFDIVSIKTYNDSHRVGKYSVDLKSFEAIAIPNLKPVKSCKDAVVVIDEIGKMELFSKSFEHTVLELFSNDNQQFILATIPIAKNKPLPLVDTLRSRSDIKLIDVVSRENRNELVQTIVDEFTK
uniref:AAA+ ATPase domain-containing protein n=1 Tax=Strigamia maritima TaxID=126957 RepID=T1IV54_STRMM